MMRFGTRFSVTVMLVVAATFASAAGCEGDEDDCMHCCECHNDGTDVVYRPEPSCSNCQEQCTALADREFMGQEFDHVDTVECPD